MKLWQPPASLLFLSLFFAASLAVQAEEVTEEQAIQTAREALGDRGKMPWYDASNDDLRPLNLPPDKSDDFDNRKSRWQSTPSTQSNTSSTPFWSSSLGEAFWTLMQILFWLLVIAILGVLIYLLVKAYISKEDALAVKSTATPDFDNEDDQERIESLPFVVARPRGDLLDEARAQYTAGNFRLAVIYLYSYLLVTLDKNQQIRLAKGKTNRQYLRELRPQPELRSVVERTMISFEDVFFGDHDLTREEFEECWSQLDRFHRHVEQVAV
ncbi:MAG TPA: DUF4129 domain-containing protein [Pirellulaceae bacterium]|nr:DUF4129 domain-containing protein [Pirellulaceae bacterium]